MTDDSWKLIRALHSYSTGTPPHVVDLLANESWLRLYASGFSVEDIATSSDVHKQQVEDVLEYYYRTFKERNETLPFNPWKLYKNSGRYYFGYETECNKIGITDQDLILDSFFVCLFYDRYKKEIEIHEGNRTS